MSEPKKPHKATTQPTIAQQLAAFDDIVSWFDSDDFELEEALQKFQRAQQLAEDIEKKLSRVKNEIEVIKQNFAS